MNLNRRLSIGTTLATGAQLSAPTVPGQATPPTVTIRSGAGGATAARHLARDSGGAIDVTLLGMNTWLGPEMGGNGVEVRPGTMEVAVAGEVTRVDGCNVIPAQKAGIIAELAQVTGGCGFAPVHPDHTKSRMDDTNGLSF
jgi:hypothetical protein